jgi:hypothetical protein
VSKTQKQLDLDDLNGADEDRDQFEYSFSDSIREKRDKMMRSTELRRKIEDRLESRRIRDQFEGFDSYSY